MPHRPSENPDCLKPFQFHGIELNLDAGADEAIGDCPFCQKEGHLYVNRNSGQWKCQRCDEAGNIDTFLRRFWEMSLTATTADDYAELAEDRGIATSILQDWGLAKSILTGEWLLPIDNDGEGLPNLYRYSNGKVLSTSGRSLQLFGDRVANKNHETVNIVEGPWDGMAMDAILRANKINGRPLRDAHAIVALPGASNCHKLLPQLCKHRHVKLLLDNDDAGRNGTRGILKAIASAECASIEVLDWGEDLPEGYDLRDLLIAKGPVKAYKSIKAMLAPEELADESTSDGELRFTCYADIKPESVRWLVADRIPLGKITILQGNPGVGKSFATADIIARVSTGSALPDGSKVLQGESALFTSEDGAADTIRPRLDLQKANAKRVYHFDCVMRKGQDSGLVDLARDVSKLTKWLGDHPAVRLLVFDPLPAFIGGNVDSHKNADVRRVLGPLKRLAEDCNVAIVGINHLSKGIGKSVYRGLGSIAFNAQARTVWQVSADPDNPDRRLFLPVKMNVAKPTGLAFAITDKGLFWEKDSVNITPDEAESDDQGETRFDEAKQWLESLLASKGLPAKEVYEQARTDQISARTLKRAKASLRVKTSRISNGWFWTLPKPAKPVNKAKPP